jgi:hypothetical protein
MGRNGKCIQKFNGEILFESGHLKDIDGRVILI